MIEPTKMETVDPETRKQILDRVMPDVMDLLAQFKTELSGVLPEELSYGMVAGYLRGRGHTWADALFGMHQWIVVVKTRYSHALSHVEGTLTVHGDKDGSVKVDIEGQQP